MVLEGTPLRFFKIVFELFKLSSLSWLNYKSVELSLSRKGRYLRISRFIMPRKRIVRDHTILRLLFISGKLIDIFQRWIYYFISTISNFWLNPRSCYDWRPLLNRILQSPIRSITETKTQIVVFFCRSELRLRIQRSLLKLIIVVIRMDILEHPQTVNGSKNLLELLFSPFVELLEISCVVDEVSGLLTSYLIACFSKESLYPCL